MGAIAGSSILECEATKELDTVTVTVNNTCNLTCPHCYLQYDANHSLGFDNRILGLLERSRFRHLAIVGKEPLYDRSSVDLCTRLADVCRSSGKTVSLITNGLNIGLAQSEFAGRFSFIDVSLDGGPASYRNYRGGSTEKLARGLRTLAATRTRINALHILNSTTITNIDDMLLASDWAPFSRVVFSPYLRTENHGFNGVNGLSLTSVLQALSRSKFPQTEGATLLVHDQHLRDGGMSRIEFRSYAEHLGLTKRVHLVAGDPIEFGIIRITYDGLVLAPHVALHTRRYQSELSVRVAELESRDLNDVFGKMALSTTMLQ